MIIDEEYEKWTQSEFMRVCRARGIELYIPDDYTLILDFDTDRQMKEFQRRLLRLRQMMIYSKNHIVDYEFKPSTTKGHFHGYVKLELPLDTLTRIGCQMFLGSDPVKELLSMQRHAAGINNPTLLALGNWKGDYVDTF